MQTAHRNRDAGDNDDQAKQASHDRNQPQYGRKHKVGDGKVEDKEVMENIMKNFGIKDTQNAHIINGHIPVEKINGETPVKANGKVIVIDGGFSKAYQKTTGIAGYTLVSGSTGMRIIAHEPFTSLEDAIQNNEDIHYSIDLQEPSKRRITIAHTDKGKELKKQIENLKLLISCYDSGLLCENKDFKYVKVLKK